MVTKKLKDWESKFKTNKSSKLRECSAEELDMDFIHI